jgi:hypothetical protein
VEASRDRHSPEAPSSPEWEAREATTPRRHSPRAEARQLVVEEVAVVGRRGWWTRQCGWWAPRLPARSSI